MYHCTFIVQPNCNLLVDIIQKADANGKQDLRQELAEERSGTRVNLDVDPVLQLENPPENYEDYAQTHQNDRKADEITKQVTLPRRIQRLKATGHRASNDTSLKQQQQWPLSFYTKRSKYDRPLWRTPFNI